MKLSRSPVRIYLLYYRQYELLQFQRVHKDVIKTPTDGLKIKAVEGELKELAQGKVVLLVAVVPAANFNDRAPVRKEQRLNETGPVEANEDVSGLHLVHLLDVGECSKIHHV